MVLIDIIIKAPNQKLEDQTIQCDLEWTVLTLKSHLSSVYPSKPRIEDQRLIYSGHLLKNEQSLREVLQPIDNDLTFTVHMVCSQSSQSSPKRTSDTMAANNSNANQSINTNNNSPTQPTNENNTRNNTNTNGFQQPINGQFSNYNTVYANPLNMNTVVIPPDQMWQQMAVMQQAYAQYMAQYFTQNPYLNQNQITPTVIPPMAPMAAPQPIINGAEAGIPVVNPAVPQPPPVQRLNAGPGGQQVIDDEDEGRNRDWLDCFYWMSRAVVLFSIIYFYSSFTRFLLVVFLSVLLYLYQTNWFNRRQQQIINNNNLLQQNVNNNNNEIRVNREEQEPNGADDTEVLERPQQLASNSVINDGRVTEERFSGLRFVWVIVSSLFTSLIPENPVVPDSAEKENDFDGQQLRVSSVSGSVSTIKWLESDRDYTYDELLDIVFNISGNKREESRNRRN